VSGALLAGLDLGTTKAKGALFDAAGAPVAAASRPYDLRRPRPGWAEQDPEDWWAATSAILAELGAAAARLGRPIGALGIVSQVNTHVFADADGHALAPAITWQDGRCAAVAAELDASVTDAERQALWGGPFTIDASYLLSRVAWIERHDPRVRERTRWVLSPKDWLVARLTGAVRSDPISSVGLTGADGTYLEGLDRVLPGVSALLPPLGAASDRAGHVRTGAAAANLERCPVAVGTMDAWGNLYGSGLRRGEGMHVAGTSEVIAVLAGPDAPGGPGIIRFPPGPDGATLLAGPTQAGGDALRWHAAAHGMTVEAVLEEAAASSPARVP
jgi:xylulokinase